MRRIWPILGTVLWIVIPTLPRHLLAQQVPAPPPAAAKPAEAQAPPAVEIADEPKTIDPATLVPAALAKPATVKFAETTLKEVVKWLQDDQKLGVLLDTKALTDGRVLMSEPVTDQLNNEPIYLLLNRLRTIGVAWYLDRGMVHLTTLAAAEKHQPTTPYTIGDLLDAKFDSLALMATLQHGIGGAWKSRDGRGGSLLLLGDVVFVMNTDEKHREAAGLLAALRKHGRRTFTLDAPQHAALRAKLEQNVTVSFTDVPLATAVEELAALAKIDLRLDRAALRAASIRERSPVTFELTDQTLATALQGLLAELNLTWVLRDGVLWITSQEDAGNFRKAAVYDVRDLCRDDADSSALRQALIGQTHGPWSDEQTAPGGSISFPKVGVMIVRQTERGHDEVLQLLENYRIALKASKPRQAPGVDPKELVVRYYRVSTVIADAVAPLLPKLVEPDTWAAADRPDAKGAIEHKLPSTSSVISAEGFDVVEQGVGGAGHTPAVLVPNTVLVIRQTREVHDKIVELLDRIENGDSRHESLGGMGGGGMGGGMGGGGFFSLPIPALKPSASPVVSDEASAP